MKTRDVKNNIKQTIAFIILQIFLTCNISMSAECLAPSLNVDGEVLSGIFSAISAGKGGGLRLHDLEDKSEFNGDASDVSKKSNVTFIGGVNSGASGIAAANLRFDLLGGDPPNPFDKVEPQNFVQRWFKYWQIRKEKDSREQLENYIVTNYNIKFEGKAWTFDQLWSLLRSIQYGNLQALLSNFSPLVLKSEIAHYHTDSSYGVNIDKITPLSFQFNMENPNEPFFVICYIIISNIHSNYPGFIRQVNYYDNKKQGHTFYNRIKKTGFRYY